VVALAALVLDASPARAQPPPTAIATPPIYERPGFAVSAGVGYTYTVFGLQLRRDSPVRPWFHLSPLVSLGMTFPGSGHMALAGAAGVSVGVGRRHRLVADAAFAPVGWELLTLHGTTLDVRVVYGPNVGVGYEHVGSGGGLQRFTIGYGWGLWSRKGEGPYPSTWTFALGFGAKLP
jgi:hypothetical protein